MSNIDYLKLEKFFSEPFDFINSSLEYHIYHSIGSEIISEKDRAKLILKISCSNISSENLSHSVISPSRHFITRLMYVMKSSDSKSVLTWMNNLQRDEAYREELKLAYRSSAARPGVKWSTHAFRHWRWIRAPLSPFRSSQHVILLPDAQTVEQYSSLDFQRRVGFDNIPMRRNLNGLPSFCMTINLESLTNCILEGPPKDCE